VLTTNAQAWNYLGLACHYAGQAAEAERAYQRALGLDRDLTEAHYNLGCLWLEQKRPEKLEGAKMELTAFILRRGNSVEGLLKLGAAQLRSREWAAAEKSLNEALRLSPQNPEALNGLGLARAERGHPNDALEYFNKALKQHPNYRPALLNQAIVAQQYVKDRALALQKYREFLATKPAAGDAEAVTRIIHQLEYELKPPPPPVSTNVPIHANVNPPARTPAQPAPVTNQAPTAKPTNILQAGLASSPTIATNAIRPEPRPVPASDSNPVAPKSVAQPVRDVDHNSAPPAASAEGLAAHPQITTSSAPTHVADARTAHHGIFQRLNPLNLIRSGEPTTARPTPLPGATSSTAPAGQPNNQSAPSLATNLAAETPPPAPVMARYAYKSPARPAPGNRAEAEPAFARGLTAYREHRVAEALQAFGQAIQVDPSYFEAHYNLGLAQTEAGNIVPALAAYESALSIQPDSPDARYNFALVLKRAGYLLDALNEFERIVSKYPNEARVHVALGNIYAQQLHQAGPARAHYLRVLELDPRNPQANAIRYWLTANPP
jgi:tetratricopeptide (TPR) repeat protein